MIWTKPKTDWKPTDRFNKEDFNRIKNNMIFLHDVGSEMYGEFDIEDMGEDITSYADYWNVSHFNAIENNLDIINKNTVQEDFGLKQTFYPNGLFIRFSELNRIEQAQARIYQLVQGWINARASIPFRLGAKGVFR